MARRSHPNDHHDWETFAEAVGHALWASPYISEVENLAEDAREERNSGNTRRAEALMAAYRALNPGPGGAWESVLPEPSRSAMRAGKGFAKKVHDTMDPNEVDAVFIAMGAEKAGWYGAMQAQGEGVGWGDYGVDVDVPDWPQGDPAIQNDIWTAIKREVRDVGIRIPPKR